MYLETKELFVEPRRSAPLEVKAEPFTLEHLISWLEATPDDEYAFGNTEDGERGCLFCRYAVHLGYSADFDGYAEMLRRFGTFPTDPFHPVAPGYPRTIKGALDRARKLLSSSERSERLS